LSSMAIAPARRQTNEPEWAVWLTVAIALVLGLLLMMQTTGQTQSQQVGNSTIVYPASWVATKDPNADFAAADLQAGGAFGARVSVSSVDTTTLQGRSGSLGGIGLREAAQAWSLIRAKQLESYRVLGITQSTLQGRDAYNIESAYVQEPTLGGGSTNTVPGLMHAVDTMVQSGGKYYILSFAAQQTQFDSLQDLHNKLLADWKLP
jgi:hypothetical protein